MSNQGKSNKRGTYIKISLDDKKRIIKESQSQDHQALASKYRTTVRRIKSILSKKDDLKNSGRKSKNKNSNDFLFEESLKYFQRFKVRPSIVGLTKFYFGTKRKYFTSNGQKMNFTKNLKTFLKDRLPAESHQSIFGGLPSSESMTKTLLKDLLSDSTSPSPNYLNSDEGTPITCDDISKIYPPEEKAPSGNQLEPDPYPPRVDSDSVENEKPYIQND